MDKNFIKTLKCGDKVYTKNIYGEIIERTFIAYNERFDYKTVCLVHYEDEGVYESFKLNNNTNHIQPRSSWYKLTDVYSSENEVINEYKQSDEYNGLTYKQMKEKIESYKSKLEDLKKKDISKYLKGSKYLKKFEDELNFVFSKGIYKKNKNRS